VDPLSFFCEWLGEDSKIACIAIVLFASFPGTKSGVVIEARIPRSPVAESHSYCSWLPSLCFSLIGNVSVTTLFLLRTSILYLISDIRFPSEAGVTSRSSAAEPQASFMKHPPRLSLSVREIRGKHLSGQLPQCNHTRCRTPVSSILDAGVMFLVFKLVDVSAQPLSCASFRNRAAENSTGLLLIFLTHSFRLCL